MTPSNKKRPFTSQSHNRKVASIKSKNKKNKHLHESSKGKIKKSLPSYM